MTGHMRIGIDFDNTIVCYDGVFHTAAVERGLIATGLAVDKMGVRNYLRSVGQEDAWTELQGYVYGKRMELATIYPGVVGFISAATAAGHTIYIISHKTKTPFLGPQYDLHAAARQFLEAHKLVDQSFGTVLSEHVFFELTMDDKIARIASQECGIFVDDLPEFLTKSGFPSMTRRILFDPGGHHSHHSDGGQRLEAYRHWSSIEEAVLGCQQ